VKVAAIDIGSNSIHMLIADVVADRDFTVIDREKDMVKLGAGCFAGGRLRDEAIAAGLHSLRKMKKLCERHRADEIVATATSAVREAANGGSFLDEIERQTGIHVDVVNGEEEGRVIYLAVRSAIDLSRKRALILDIGGGSVEAIVGGARDLASARVMKLGVQRLRDRMLAAGATDPLSRKDRKRLEDMVRDEAEPVLKRARDMGYEQVVGTSGTILALGAAVLARRGGVAFESPNNVPVRRADLAPLVRELAELDAAGRAKAAGIDPRRADTIHLGGILLEGLLDLAKADEIVLCNRALREGLIIDYIERNTARVERRVRVPDLRRRSLLELLARSGADERVTRHHHHVARLALSLFDQTPELHGLGLGERRLLEHAALVHDVGGQIAFERHERHSYYLIRNADLRGFTQQEIDLIALIARYHRGPAPRRRQREYGALRKRERRVVKRLAALLRVADGLDRSHFQVVRGVRVQVGDEKVRIGVEAVEDAELEVFTAARKGAFFERVFRRALDVAILPARAAPWGGAAEAAEAAAAREDAPAGTGAEVRARAGTASGAAGAAAAGG
jgi:exopolyphosphatase/guanosine-5'-triphosphate,3'-diphosphate pyrophosphatase